MSFRELLNNQFIGLNEISLSNKRRHRTEEFADKLPLYSYEYV
jgi:hypothetical protein